MLQSSIACQLLVASGQIIVVTSWSKLFNRYYKDILRKIVKPLFVADHNMNEGAEQAYK